MAKKSVKQKMADPEKEIFRGIDIGKQNAGGKIPYLETSIDKFYHLIKQKGSMNFYQAAAEYGVDKEQIASWARILEENKLAKVHYPVFGSPVIIIGEETPKKRRGEESGEEDEAKHGAKGSGKRPLKISMVLIAGLMVLFGSVMVVNNPTTIAIRVQITAAAQRLALLFWFLPYPLSIIAPVAIIIAAVLIFLVIRRRRKSPKLWLPGKDAGGKAKADRRRLKDRQPEAVKPLSPSSSETPSGKEAAKEEKKGKKKGQPKRGRNDIEEKLSRIKKELGS
jgi:hypothetical protein